MACITINYTIPFGASIRIGYQIANSSNPFTYVTGYPTYADSPYVICGLPLGSYNVELTTICPNCTGGVFGTPVVYPAVSM